MKGLMRINQTATAQTTNHEGGKAYELPLAERFISRLATSLWQEPAFYGDTTNELVEEAKALPPHFVAAAAVYARESLNLRTTPTVLTAIVAMHPQSDVQRILTPKLMQRVLTRPDQLTEFVAYLNSVGAKKVLNRRQVKKGLAAVISKFDAYQLAKYNRDGKVKLRDILMIAHPKPADLAQAELWKQLLEDRLPTPITWETELSAKGNKLEVWDALIKEEKLPYMAALRNLRNIIESGASQLPVALAMIADPERVAKSKQLPFRFYSAANELRSVNGAGPALVALEKALTAAAANLPVLAGITFTSADNSGSMEDPLSAKSKVKRRDVANLFQALMLRKQGGQTITSVFGRDFALVNVPATDSIQSNIERFASTNVGHASSGYLVVKHLVELKMKVDRIIIFTDEQIYGGDLSYWWSAYRRIAPDCWLHLVNLAGYGTVPVMGDHVSHIAGWSESIFQFIAHVEQGTGTMIKHIESIEL